MSAEQMATFSLSIVERIHLIRLLQDQQGNVMTMRVVEQFVRDLGFTEEEIERWGIVVSTQGTRWNDTAESREFSFTPWRLKKVQEVLRAMDAKGTVTLDQLRLFTLFLPQPGEASDPELAAELAALSAQTETQNDAESA